MATTSIAFMREESKFRKRTEGNPRSFFCLVKSRIEGIEILAVQAFLHDAHQFAKALIMHDLPGSEEFHHLVDIGIITEAQDIFIGGACLLLWYDLISTTYSLLF